MLKEANTTCRRLWRDESGVVLAMTVVVFLTLFILACSVYAVGENIRQRIELQNAVDSAAYSAAVVQADGLSRIAALNLAMSWAYVELVKDQMDYIVDEWLDRTLTEWSARDEELKEWATSPSRCDPDDYWIGKNRNSRQHLKTMGAFMPGEPPSPPKWRGIDELRGALSKGRSQFSQIQAAGRIVHWRRIIEEANVAEEEIVRVTLGEEIKKAIKEDLKRNLIQDNSSSDLLFAQIIEEPGNYLTTDVDEGQFVSFIGRKLEDEVGAGLGDWYVSGGGIRRKYADGKLSASWNFKSWHHKEVDNGEGSSDCQSYAPWGNSDIVFAGIGLNAKYKETPTAKPWVLEEGAFFYRTGSIVVAAARPIQNPLAFLPIFNITPASYMWAVSAARAGFFDKRGTYGNTSDRAKGEYNSTCDAWKLDGDSDELDDAKWDNIWRLKKKGWSRHWKMQNLAVVDWDAILLPLQHAWTGRIPTWKKREGSMNKGDEFPAGKWAETASMAILSELWSSSSWLLLEDQSPFVDGLKNVSSNDIPGVGLIDFNIQNPPDIETILH